jgi:hypothetical protein
MRTPTPRTMAIIGIIMVGWHILYFLTDGAVVNLLGQPPAASAAR